MADNQEKYKPLRPTLRKIGKGLHSKLTISLWIEAVLLILVIYLTVENIRFSPKQGVFDYDYFTRKILGPIVTLVLAIHFFLTIWKLYGPLKKEDELIADIGIASLSQEANKQFSNNIARLLDHKTSSTIVNWNSVEEGSFLNMLNNNDSWSQDKIFNLDRKTSPGMLRRFGRSLRSGTQNLVRGGRDLFSRKKRNGGLNPDADNNASFNIQLLKKEIDGTSF